MGIPKCRSKLLLNICSPHFSILDSQHTLTHTLTLVNTHAYTCWAEVPYHELSGRASQTKGRGTVGCLLIALIAYAAYFSIELCIDLFCIFLDTCQSYHLSSHPEKGLGLLKRWLPNVHLGVNCICIIWDICQKCRSRAPFQGNWIRLSVSELWHLCFLRSLTDSHGRAFQCWLIRSLLSSQQKGRTESFCSSVGPQDFGKWAMRGSDSASGPGPLITRPLTSSAAGEAFSGDSEASPSKQPGWLVHPGVLQSYGPQWTPVSLRLRGYVKLHTSWFILTNTILMWRQVWKTHFYSIAQNQLNHSNCLNPQELLEVEKAGKEWKRMSMQLTTPKNTAYFCNSWTETSAHMSSENASLAPKQSKGKASSGSGLRCS